MKINFQNKKLAEWYETPLAKIIQAMCSKFIGGSKGGRQGRAPPPGGPNSFIFMQFSAKN